jgi:hypothetical protein
VVRNIMRSRLQLAASKNCDAVEMDDVDAYQNNPVILCLFFFSYIILNIYV